MEDEENGNEVENKEILLMENINQLPIFRNSESHQIRVDLNEDFDNNMYDNYDDDYDEDYDEDYDVDLDEDYDVDLDEEGSFLNDEEVPLLFNSSYDAPPEYSDTNYREILEGEELLPSYEEVQAEST